MPGRRSHRGEARLPPPGGPGGFGLVEVTLAVLILSATLLGAAGLIVGTSAIERQASTRRAMIELGDGKLEELRAYAAARTADTLQLGIGGSLTSSQANHADEVTTPEGRRYFRRWLVSAGPAGSREVTLRVERADGGGHGALHHLDVSTYLMIVTR